jgi:hypothetical protein
MAVPTVAPRTPDLTTPVSMLEYCGAKSTGFTLNPANQLLYYKSQTDSRLLTVSQYIRFKFNVPALDSPASPSAIMMRTIASK